MSLLNRTLPGAALLLAAFGALAAPITLTLGGRVSSVDAPLAGVFKVGDAVSVTLVYDSATPAAASDASSADYDFQQFRMSFGSYAASFASSAADGTSFVAVENDVTGFLGPADAFGATSVGHASGAAVAGVALQQGFFALWDTTQTALSSNALPTLPSLADFAAARLAGLSFCADVGCGVGSALGSVEATLDSMTVMGGPLPAPPTIWLVLPALALLARRRSGAPLLPA